MGKARISLLVLFAVATAGLASGASSARALPVESLVESRCSQSSNSTVSVDGFNISLNGSQVDEVNCSKTGAYNYPEFEPPERPDSSYTLDKQGYYGLLTVLMMVPVAVSLFLYGKGFPHVFGATLIALFLAVLSPGIWSYLGQGKSAVVIPVALAVSGVSHIFVTERKRERLYVGGVYVVALMAVSLAHNLSLSVLAIVY